jgi:hypothetical protein
MTTKNFNRGLIIIGVLAFLMVLGNLALVQIINPDTATAPAPTTTTTQTTPAPTEDQTFTKILCGLGTNPDVIPECAGLGFTTEQALKTELIMENSPGNRATWEAWQASAASGATTSEGRQEAFAAEMRKQAEQHADASRPFLHGTCQPNDEWEKNNKEVLKRYCKDAEAQFQRDYWLALEGDHQAQANVAFCFRGTPLALFACQRAVASDETEMCAWLLVAASSGHPQSAKSAEEYGYIYECDKKPIYERQAILGTASALFLRIYHRPMPHATTPTYAIWACNNTQCYLYHQIYHYDYKNAFTTADACKTEVARLTALAESNRQFSNMPIKCIDDKEWVTIPYDSHAPWNEEPK